MSAPFPKGGRVFMLPNQTGQIQPDLSSHLVSLYLEAAQLPKSSGWFRSDTSLGLSFKVTATYNSSGGGDTSIIPVTKAYSFDVTKDRDGNVSLPLQSLAVVNSCPLMVAADGKRSYLTDLSSNVTFLATRESAGFGLALQEVFKLSGKLPIPNPYTPFVSLLGEGISDMIQKVQEQDSNRLPLAGLGFQFSGPASKPSGHYVLLMSADQHVGNGFVDLDQMDENLLGFHSEKGLTYNGASCRNAYVVFHLAYVSRPKEEDMPRSLSAGPEAGRGRTLVSPGEKPVILAERSLAEQFLLPPE